MKAKLFAAAALAGMTLIAQSAETTPAPDSNPFYTRLELGVATQGDIDVTELLGVPVADTMETATGLRLGVAGGYRLNTALSLELEAGLIYNPIDRIGESDLGQDGVDLNLYQVPLMASVVYTPLKGRLTPYVALGAGGVLTGIDGDERESAVTYAWQVKAGADFRISDQYSAGLAYKLLGSGENDWNGLMKADPILTHSFVATLTWKF